MNTSPSNPNPSNPIAQLIRAITETIPPPLLIILLGAVLFVLGAVGEIPAIGPIVDPIKIKSYDSIALLIVGILIILAGLLVVISENAEGTLSNLIGYFQNRKHHSRESIKDILDYYANRYEEVDYLAYASIDRNSSTSNDNNKPKLEYQYQNTELPDRIEFFLGDEISEKDLLDGYRDLAKRLHENIEKLNEDFHLLQQGILIRTVFDVEKGGFFYYHIDDHKYLFGATVNQGAMARDEVDRVMRRMLNDIMNYFF